MNSVIFDATEANFDEAVLKASHETPVLVDFWADWCGPCLVLTPVLDRVVRALGGVVRLAKVEADENMRLVGRYQVRGFPTVILFSNGEPLARFSSARPDSFVRDFIMQHLEGAPGAARL